MKFNKKLMLQTTHNMIDCIYSDSTLFPSSFFNFFQFLIHQFIYKAINYYTKQLFDLYIIIYQNSFYSLSTEELYFSIFICSIV